MICIHGNIENIHIRGIYFAAVKGADYNRCLWSYETTRFSYWEVVVVVEVRRWGSCKVLTVHKMRGCQNRTSVNKGACEGALILAILLEGNN